MTSLTDPDSVPVQPAAGPSAPAPVSFREALRVWVRVAALSFGGPAGQIAVMHRILVEEKRWIGEARFLHALNYCMLLPGPEAQQLATYIGWLMHGTRGALAAGLLFILPGVVAIMALSVLYALFGQVGPVAALFFGLKAAVIAIVLAALVRLARKALHGPALVLIAGLAFVLIFAFGVPFPVIVLGAGLAGLAAGRAGLKGFTGAAAEADDAGATVLGEGMPDHARRSPMDTARVVAGWLAIWLVPVAALVVLLGPRHVLAEIATFFSGLALVTFGGAYAVLAYVAQEAVEGRGWLEAGQMLDGLGMAETTPGPLIMVLQFVGFMAAHGRPEGLPPLLAGAAGGLIATWVTFAPCFLFVLAGAPYVERVRGNRAIAGALSAITAAVVGVILNLAVWFALHTIFSRQVPFAAGPLRFERPDPASLDPWALSLAVACILAMVALRAGMGTVLAGAAAAGLALHALGWIG